MTAGRLRLILTRHAKSSWDDPAIDDHERPLNARGLRAALELGDWLASRGYLPDEVLCSTARRTAETWAAVERTPLEVLPKVKMVPELYHASSDFLLRRLQKAAGDTVMLIGHNPGLGELAAMLVASAPPGADFRKYPTCATLVLDFYQPGWSDIRPGGGDMRDFFTPTDRG